MDRDRDNKREQVLFYLTWMLKNRKETDDVEQSNTDFLLINEIDSY